MSRLNHSKILDFKYLCRTGKDLSEKPDMDGFVAFCNEHLGLECDDAYQDDEELCANFKQSSIDYMWELYLSLKD